MRHGIPSNSGAVQGYRYNARVLARELARRHFGIDPPRPPVAADDVVSFLLREARYGPELWHQRSYLARVLSMEPHGGILDEGTLPLGHFLDAAPYDGAAIVLESNGHDDLYPVLYIKRSGTVSEHAMPPNPLLDFQGDEYRDAVAAALQPLLGPSLTRR